MPDTPNLLFILADQLRAASLPIHGEGQIETPNLDRLAAEGVLFRNAISTCPVCTPYRAMLLTGRHPQTTGHVMNFVRTRHDEISIGDAFARAGYRTAWIGKWHLHTGSFPEIDGPDIVPEGRPRLGFDHWRGYNFHMTYFDGWVNKGPSSNEQWQGYETDALSRLARDFIDREDGRPFCLFVSPHQPHYTPGSFAPAECYQRVPNPPAVPDNVPASVRAESAEAYRHYLAMTVALDDMVGELLIHLDRRGRTRDTLVVFTSDHGTQGGARGISFWHKLLPYEDCLHVPLIVRLPGVLAGGVTQDTLVAPVDLFPTLARICGAPVPHTVEGFDLSAAWRGDPGAFEQDALLTMNFSAEYDYLVEGQEWRGVRTKHRSYTEWLNGRVELFDLLDDPLQMRNLADDPGTREERAHLQARLHDLMAARDDRLAPCRSYGSWLDEERRIIANSSGPLGDPEADPDWSRFG